MRGAGDRASKRTSILAGFGSPRPSADVTGDSNSNNNGVSEKEREKERKHAGSPLSEKTAEANPPLPSPPLLPPTAAAPSTPTPGSPEEPSVEMHVSPTGGISHSQTQPLHRRAATVLDPQGHAKRHERRSSTGGALLSLSSVTGTIGRHRRPSTSHGSGGSGSMSASAGSRPSQGSERPFTQTVEVPEEDAMPVRPSTARPERQHARVNGTGHELITDGEDEANASAADKDFKPVFLKGLFSVATTSTKQPAALKTDIRRVLDRMQVQYRETRTGFDCIHLPSIDISSLQQDPLATPTPSPRKHRKQGSAGSGDSGGTTKRIARKASKLSFGMLSQKDKDRGGGEPSVNGTTATTSHNKEKEKEREVPGRQSGSGAATTTFNATQSSGSSSFFNVSSNAPTVHADDHSASLQLQPDDSPRRSNSPARSKNLPPIPRDFAATPQPFPTGEVDREVFESVGRNTLSVRFEINIVKVPWLPLHGIQFRRAGGDGWQYQMLARRVLTELKL